MRKKAVHTGGGISPGTTRAILADDAVASPDDLAQTDAIVEDEVRAVQARQKTTGKSDTSEG